MQMHSILAGHLLTDNEEGTAPETAAVVAIIREEQLRRFIEISVALIANPEI